LTQQSNDFDDDAEVIPKAAAKKGKAPVQEVDDWDIEDDQGAGYIRVPSKAKGPAETVNNFAAQRPGTAVAGSRPARATESAWTAQINQPPPAKNSAFTRDPLPATAQVKKRVIPKQTKQDDVDELDDLMGMGSSDS
jgi:hypothetical protein